MRTKLVVLYYEDRLECRSNGDFPLSRATPGSSVKFCARQRRAVQRQRGGGVGVVQWSDVAVVTALR